MSPAYDLLSTIPYIPGDEAALKFRRWKAWASFNYDELAAIADKANVAQEAVLAVAGETVDRFGGAWADYKASLSLTDMLIKAIEGHRASLAI